VAVLDPVAVVFKPGHDGTQPQPWQYSARHDSSTHGRIQPCLFLTLIITAFSLLGQSSQVCGLIIIIIIVCDVWLVWDITHQVLELIAGDAQGTG
jgi:hypothetical protein